MRAPLPFRAAAPERAPGAGVGPDLDPVPPVTAQVLVTADEMRRLERLEASGVAITALHSEADLARLAQARDRWDYALDAVLGTGARGAPEGLAAAAVQTLRELDEAGTRVVAVDLPTGVHADTGEI